MSDSGFSVEQWIEELRLAQAARPAEGESLKEMMQRTGFSQRRLSDLLQAARSMDRLTVSKRIGTGIDGRVTNTPVYKILPAKRKKQDKH